VRDNEEKGIGKTRIGNAGTKKRFPRKGWKAAGVPIKERTSGVHEEAVYLEGRKRATSIKFFKKKEGFEKQSPGQSSRTEIGKKT